jgi:spore maturation protein CgeB
LYDSKIVLHANPDWWEGDARLWEAVASGALVFVDRMCQPIAHPFVDGVHVIFYDLTDDGMRELERRVLYYLAHDDERETIGRRGREFALARHRAVDRVETILDLIERREGRRGSASNAPEDPLRRHHTTWVDPVILRLPI